MSFFHVAEYLLFRNPADLLHYNYCTKNFSYFNLVREGIVDRIIGVSLAFTSLAKLISYIIIFINRDVKKAGFLMTFQHS
jgi:hypothetical protein